MTTPAPHDTPNTSRRQFAKRLAYVAPVILSLQAAPQFAKAGSVKSCPPGQVGNTASKSPKWKDC